MKDVEDYTKKLKEMAVEIEKRSQERTIEETYSNVFKLLKNIFGNKNEQELVKDFERELVKKGRTDPKNLHIINHLIDAKKRYKSKKKPSKYEIEEVRKNATFLINNLIEYGQRCDLSEIRKMQVRVNYKENGQDKHAELFLTNPIYVIIDNQFKKIIEKDEKARFEEGKQDEFDNILSTQKGKPHNISEKVLELLKRELKDFNMSF